MLTTREGLTIVNVAPTICITRVCLHTDIWAAQTNNARKSIRSFDDRPFPKADKWNLCSEDYCTKHTYSCFSTLDGALQSPKKYSYRLWKTVPIKGFCSSLRFTWCQSNHSDRVSSADKWTGKAIQPNTSYKAAAP